MTSLLDSAKVHATALGRTRSIPGKGRWSAKQHDKRGATAFSTLVHQSPQWCLRPSVVVCRDGAGHHAIAAAPAVAQVVSIISVSRSRKQYACGLHCALHRQGLPIQAC
jgi:hypothetical protein